MSGTNIFTVNLMRTMPRVYSGKIISGGDRCFLDSHYGMWAHALVPWPWVGLQALDAITAFCRWLDSSTLRLSFRETVTVKSCVAVHELPLVERLDRHIQLLRDLGTDRFARTPGDWKASGL